MTTRQQKEDVRRTWPHMKLRFRSDGSVEAQQRAGGPWGILYSPADLERHIEIITDQTRTKR